MRLFLQGLQIVGVLFFYTHSVSAEPQIEVSLNPSDTLKVGTLCQLTLRVVWRNQEGGYRFTQPHLDLENLVLEEMGESNEAFQKEGETWSGKTFQFRLRATQKGRGKIHPFQLAYLDPANQLGGHFKVQALEISVVPDRTGLYRNMALTLGLLAAGGLVWGSFVFWKRFAPEKTATDPIQPSLEERYLISLNAAQDQLFEADKLLRSYLREKYSLAKGAITTREMIDQVKEKTSVDELKILQRIFDKLETWQFGNQERSSEEHRRLWSEIIRFVEGKKVI